MFFAAQVFAAETHRLTILHFNDIHGYLMPPFKNKPSRGGAAKIAAEIKKIEKENDAAGASTIVLFGGDAFTGGIVSRAFKGQAELDFFNAIEPDAFVIGNHDFDFGRKRLESWIKDAKFPVMSANMVAEGGKPFAKDLMFITTKDGLRIGIVGIGYPNRNIYLKENIEGLKFASPAKTAKREWSALNDNSDVQIALTHIGVDADVKLAKGLPGLDAVIGGHDHVKPDEYCRKVETTPVCQTPANGLYLGRVDLEIKGGKVVDSETRLIPIDSTIKPDEPVAKIVERHDSAATRKYDVVIGRALDRLGHERDKESPLGDFVTDAMRETAGADVAMLNGGGLRKPMARGPIRLKDIYEVLPFDNTLVTVTTSGEGLRQMLGFATTTPNGTRLQVSGVKFRIAGKKIADVEIGGQPLDEKKIYTVVTVNFLADGGDGFKMPKNAKVKSSGVKINDAVADFIRKNKVVRVPEGKRISI